MGELLERTIHCPYCGENTVVLIDGSVQRQNYIEDCHVCCRPIALDIAVESDGDVTVIALSENE